MKKLVLLVAIATLAAACCNCRNSSPKNHKPLDATLWELQQCNGQNVASLAETPQDIPTLRLSPDGSFGGYGGCNSYGGQAKITPSEIEYQKSSVGKIELGNAYSTKRFCKSLLEPNYFAALGRVDSFTIENDMLYLFADGELILVFKAKKE